LLVLFRRPTLIAPFACFHCCGHLLLSGIPSAIRKSSTRKPPARAIAMLSP
jgi:hypothetical protein